MKQSLTQAQAGTFAAWCHDHGFTYLIKSSSVICISKKFPIGDRAAFVDCDMTACDILGKAPLKGGSIWGTDGGSIGGAVALKTGQFYMNKSGDGVRFMTALRKLDGGTNHNSQLKFA